MPQRERLLLHLLELRLLGFRVQGGAGCAEGDAEPAEKRWGEAVVAEEWGDVVEDSRGEQAWECRSAGADTREGAREGDQAHDVAVGDYQEAVFLDQAVFVEVAEDGAFEMRVLMAIAYIACCSLV